MIKYDTIQKGDKQIIRVKPPHTIFQYVTHLKKEQREMRRFMKKMSKVSLTYKQND